MTRASGASGPCKLHLDTRCPALPSQPPRGMFLASIRSKLQRVIRRTFDLLTVVSLPLTVATLVFWILAQSRKIQYLSAGTPRVYVVFNPRDLLMQYGSAGFVLCGNAFGYAVQSSRIPGFATFETVRIFHIHYWILVLLTAAPAVLRLTLVARRPVSIGHCPNCGYDLRATPDRCPECGRVPDAVKSTS